MKSSQFLVAVLAATGILLAGCATDPVQLGYEAAQKGDYQAAVNYWTPEARRGNPRALFNLGLLAEEGLGMPKDRDLAIKFHTMAAQAGLQEARFELARLGAPVPERKPIDPNVLLMLMMMQNQQQQQPYRPVVPPVQIPPTYRTNCERDYFGNVNCTTRQQ